MRKWLRTAAHHGISRGARPQYQYRQFGTISTTSDFQDAERVSIQCGLSGHVTIYLMNVHMLMSSSNTNLLFYLPPFSSTYVQKQNIRLPEFCHRFPTAVVKYRWSGFGDSKTDGNPSEPSQELWGQHGGKEDKLGPPKLHWPTPLHDVMKAYDWVLENLKPADSHRRDILAYGSYLGASLAASLAMTESRPGRDMAVRGFAAFNGIYRWTSFLPEHKFGKETLIKPTKISEEMAKVEEDPAIQKLKSHIKTLFVIPENLFDPFASPALFFQTAGLWSPPDFSSSTDPARAYLETRFPPRVLASQSPRVKALTDALSEMMREKPPQSKKLKFPTYDDVAGMYDKLNQHLGESQDPDGAILENRLVVPEALLLHSPLLSPSGLPGPKVLTKAKKKDVVSTTSFQAEARRLAQYMCRSNEDELRKVDSEGNELPINDEDRTSIEVEDAGLTKEAYELSLGGEDRVTEWLEERMWQ